MRERLIVSLTGIPVVLAITFVGGWPFLALVMMALLIGVREFVKLGDIGLPSSVILSVSVVGCSFAAKLGGSDGLMKAVGLALFVLFCWEVFAANRSLDAAAVMRSAFGLIYLGFLGCFLVLIRFSPTGYRDTILLLLSVWAFDVFSFLVGRKLGRHRLTPRISPQKTVEGLMGGIVASVAVSTLVCGWHSIPVTFGLGFGLVVGMSAQVGDLLESTLKRSAHVKDSGGLLPGHGGMLDRIDGLLVAAPMAFLLIRWWTLGAK